MSSVLYSIELHMKTTFNYKSISMTKIFYMTKTINKASSYKKTIVKVGFEPRSQEGSFGLGHWNIFGLPLELHFVNNTFLEHY